MHCWQFFQIFREDTALLQFVREDTALLAICQGGYCTVGNYFGRLLHCRQFVMEDTALFAICKGGYCTAGNLSRRILHCGNLFLREETALLVIFKFGTFKSAIRCAKH